MCIKIDLKIIFFIEYLQKKNLNIKVKITIFNIFIFAIQNGKIFN